MDATRFAELVQSLHEAGPVARGKVAHGELEQLVSELVESGRYRSAGEVVREGLRLLAVRDEADRVKLGALRRMIQEGLDSGPAGPLDMDEIIATARAERLRLDATMGGRRRTGGQCLST